MLLFDGHLDLALNAVDWNRDLRQSVDNIRRQENELGMTQPGRCTNTLSLPELRAAGVGVCLTTLLARQEEPINHDFGHTTPQGCYAYAHAHLAYYRAMEKAGWMRMIKTKSDLEKHVAAYNAAPDSEPLGIILAMEGADPLLEPSTVEEFHELGLRALGLTHYGPNRYGGGTNSEVGLALNAVELLQRTEELAITIDLTHLSDLAFWQTLDNFGGRVHASHQNSRRICDWQRQFSDDQYKAVIDRNGVIGMAFDIIMMQNGYVRWQSKNEVTIERAIDNIDIVCQLAGNANHVGMGTDLDGCFGNEQTPADLNRYTDLPPNLLDGLSKRGYSDDDVKLIMHGNWLRFFGEVLPD